ncbi:MAG: cysteine hydrolase family protein [Rhizobium sp.]|nr:cysteine hydrolase family protein [Rhizobium sp.]
MSATALILVDFQNDYFDGGAFTLVGTATAAATARRVLDHFRAKGGTVVHVRHHAGEDDATFFVPGTQGAEINAMVEPREGEHRVTKSNINAFLGTDLKAILDAQNVTDLVVVGAMSHMCIDAVVRAASDMGYRVTVVHDAVATRDLDFDGKTVMAAEVHAAFMAALGFAYAEIVSADAYFVR